MNNAEKTVLQCLTDYGFELFTKTDLLQHCELTSQQIDAALHTLAKGELILQLERGKYAKYGFSDAFALGCFVAPNSVISYWSAMNYHRLTEQIPNVIFVQTSAQKTSKKIQYLNYRFIWLNESKIFGYKTIKQDNAEIRIADTEKTIIDCFDMPQYSGGLPEIIKAFYKAELNAKRLTAYCKKMNNISLTKRLAYLTELFEKKEMSEFLQYAQQVKNEKYNLFEAGGEKKGTLLPKWNLILNVSEKEILNMATI